LDYIIGLLDWDLNVDPDFKKNRFAEPKPVKPLAKMQVEGYEEYWISYKSPEFSAKELRVYPGKTVTIIDKAAYGLITIQGHGRFGVLDIDSPALIRFGQMTSDELFVTVNAAKQGIKISNTSPTDTLVILKHFGPEL
ncbi:MAG: hypothetical protein WCP87_05500, partial [Atribacterota bacterium]